MSAVVFGKGGSAPISFTKGGARVHAVDITLNWQAPAGADLDASLVVCGADKQVLPSPMGDWWVGYVSSCRTADDQTTYRVAPDKVAQGLAYLDPGKPTVENLAVIHSGDDLSGASGETIRVYYNRLPSNAVELVAVVSINTPGLTFGKIASATVSIKDAETGEELAASTDLSKMLQDETVAIYVKIVRDSERPDEWHVKGVGMGWDEGLTGLARAYGLDAQ